MRGDLSIMQIKLWGVRGSLPSPLTNNEYREKLQKILDLAVSSGLQESSKIDSFIQDLPHDLRHVYGGDTTCAMVTSDSGKIYIIDGGTGIRQLGNELIQGACGRGEGEVNIFLTHNHWDHIQGIPFFKPIYIPGNIIRFYSPYPSQEELLNRQMSAPNFPATFDGTASTKEFHLLKPGTSESYQLEEDLTIDLHPLTHPNGSFAYRFRQKGKTFIFATDAEFTGETLEKLGTHSEFFLNPDLLVLDSQYTLEESFMKIDWGHTSYTMAVNCALRWNAKQLVLTHHEPDYRDNKLYENYQLALQHARDNRNDTLKIHLAREGITFDL